jgi:hypothetical protein
MSQVVLVYILSNESKSDRVYQLQSLFSSSLFQVEVVNIPNTIYTPHETIDSLDSDSRVLSVLNKSYSHHGNRFTLIIKDNSTTNCSCDDIDEIVSAAIERYYDNDHWDICYLTKWLDRCDLYSHKTTIDKKSTVFVKTRSPHGVQAMLFSPHGRNIILGYKSFHDGSFFHLNKSLSTVLNSYIEHGLFKAICAFPNVFEYDVTTAKGVTDLAKLSQCRRPENNGKKSPGAFPFIVFLAVVIGTILLVWALYYLGPQYRRRDNNITSNDNNINNNNSTINKTSVASSINIA